MEDFQSTGSTSSPTSCFHVKPSIDSSISNSLSRPKDYDFKLTEDTITGGNEDIVTSTYEQLLLSTRPIKYHINIDKELNAAADHPVLTVGTSIETNIEVAYQGFVTRYQKSGDKPNSYSLVEDNYSTSSRQLCSMHNSSPASNGLSHSEVPIDLQKETSIGIYSEISNATNTKEQQQGLPYGHEPSASPDVNDASAVYTEVCEDETYAEVTPSYSTTSEMLSIMESKSRVHEHAYIRIKPVLIIGGILVVAVVSFMGGQLRSYASSATNDMKSLGLTNTSTPSSIDHTLVITQQESVTVEESATNYFSTFNEDLIIQRFSTKHWSVGEKITTPVTGNHGYHRTAEQFVIIAYPNGVNELFRGYVGVHLHLQASPHNKPLTVVATISAVTKQNKPYQPQWLRSELKVNHSMEFDYVKTHQNILTPANELLVNDSLVIRVQWSYPINERLASPLIDQKVEKPTAMSGSIVYTWTVCNISQLQLQEGAALASETFPIFATRDMPTFHTTLHIDTQIISMYISMESVPHDLTLPLSVNCTFSLVNSLTGLTDQSSSHSETFDKVGSGWGSSKPFYYNTVSRPMSNDCINFITKISY